MLEKMEFLSNLLAPPPATGAGANGSNSQPASGTGFILPGSSAANQPSASETIDKLCDRMVHSTLLEDRRAAVMSLKSLSRDYRLEVGTKAMPILLQMLKQQDVDGAELDFDTIRAIIDTMINLCDSSDSSSTRTTSPVLGSSDSNSSQNLGTQFSEIFIKDSANLKQLLQNLELVSPLRTSSIHPSEFHIVYSSLELLKILLATKRKVVQDKILGSCAATLNNLIDLLFNIENSESADARSSGSDSRWEVLRNEALLVLIDLTYHNTDLQKIVAFEETFERLFAIIDGDCGLHGPPENSETGSYIAQDCFQLMINLLEDNVSNQSYFRESRLIQRLKPYFLMVNNSIQPTRLDSGSILFTVPPTEKTSWQEQKRKNVSMALSVLLILLGGLAEGASKSSCSSSDSTTAPSSGVSPSSIKGNRDSMYAAGLYDMLVVCCVNDDSPLKIKAKALKTLALMMKEHDETKAAFSRSSVRSDPAHSPTPLFLGVLKMCLNSESPISGSKFQPSLNGAEALNEWKDVLAVRNCAFLVLKYYISGNQDFKKVLLKMIGLTSSDQNKSSISGSIFESVSSQIGSNDTPGSLVVGAMFDWISSRRRDGFRSWFASMLMSYLIAEPTFASPSEKADFLKIVIGENSSNPSGSGENLLPRIMYAAMACSREPLQAPQENISSPNAIGSTVSMGLESYTNQLSGGLSNEGRILTGYLILLSCWMIESPKVVEAFLLDGANFSFLIERISASGTNAALLIQSLACYVLGLCFEFNEDEVPGLTRESIQSIVISRIGIDTFAQRLSYLKDFLNSNKLSSPSAIVLFDDIFSDASKGGLIDRLIKNVVDPNVLKIKQKGNFFKYFSSF